jgi:hypothetical protein
MKARVDIEGAGESLTRVTSSEAFTLEPQSTSALRSLSVECTQLVGRCSALQEG